MMISNDRQNDLIHRVNKFLGSKTFLAITESLQASSIFSMVGTTHLERWHSAFLAWLLNPACNHELEFFPLKRFLAASLIAARDTEGIDGVPKLHEIEAAEFSECAVLPCPLSNGGLGEKTVFVLDDNKKSKNKCSFDVALTAKYAIPDGCSSQKLLLIVENKIKASEHDGQTYYYANWAWENKSKYPITEVDNERGTDVDKRVLVFLTPWREGKYAKPSDPRFVPVCYQSLNDLVLEPCLAHPKLSERGRLLIKEYIASLIDSGSVLTMQERSFLGDLERDYMQTMNDMIDAEKFSSAAQVGNTGEGKPFESLTDLYNAKLLKNGQQLVYTRRGLDTRAQIVVETFGEAFLKVAGKTELFGSPSGAARAILEGQSCQGWNYFRLEGGERSGEKLATLREEYRKLHAVEGEAEPAWSQETGDYVRSIFDTHEETFARIQLILRELYDDAGFSFPLRNPDGKREQYKYSLLLNRLPHDHGVVKAYFRGDEKTLYDIDLSDTPQIIIDDEGCSGLQATRKKVEGTEYQNASNSYQWASYWHVAEGNYRGKSFLDAYKAMLD